VVAWGIVEDLPDRLAGVSAMRPSTVSAMCRGSFAWTSMSAALPARRRAAFFDSLLHSSLWL